MSFDDLIKNAEDLRAKSNFKEEYDLLAAKVNDPEFNKPDVLWRKARAAKSLANVTTNTSEYNKLIYDGLESAKSGLNMDANSPHCNKWYGIFMDLSGRIEGIKKRIENSYDVKKHLEVAKQNLKEPDFGVYHALGVWCYEVSDLSWINRKIASAFFASPPTSTYEESVENLLLAEKAQPDYYAPNSLYLGKAYERLKKKQEAKTYLEKCLNFEGTDNDTINARKEAAGLLKKL